MIAAALSKFRGVTGEGFACHSDLACAPRFRAGRESSSGFFGQSVLFLVIKQAFFRDLNQAKRWLLQDSDSQRQLIDVFNARRHEISITP
jgi:hypothetical protein